MPGHLSDPPMTELVLGRGRDRHCDVTSVSVYFGYIYYNAAGKLESFFKFMVISEPSPFPPQVFVFLQVLEDY